MPQPGSHRYDVWRARLREESEVYGVVAPTMLDHLG